MRLIGVTGQAGSGKDSAADYLVRTQGFTKVALADPLKRFCREVYDFSEEQLWGPSSARNAPDKRYVRETNLRHAWMAREDPGPNGVRLCEQCGMTTEEVDWGSECVVYLTPRYALQLLGTEWGRTCYPNTWVDLMIRTSRAILDEGYSYTGPRGLHHDPTKPRAQGVIVTDVRFYNEFDAIRSQGGVVWRVRPPQEAKPASEAWRTHLSEAEQATMADESFDALIVNAKVAFAALYADVDRVYAAYREHEPTSHP